MLLRMLAPLLVASTLALCGTGVAMIVVGHRGGQLRTLHTFSFVAWGVLIGVHVLAYLTRVLRDGTMDWRHNAVVVVAGVRSRRAMLVGARSPALSWPRRRFPPSGPSCTRAVTATTTRAAAASASSSRRPTAAAVSGARCLRRTSETCCRSPLLSVRRSRAQQLRPGTAFSAGTTESLRSTEVLCRTGHQLDLQVLCGPHGELDSGPDAAGRCSAMLSMTTELRDLQGFLRE